jgi:hypothetical protein
VKKGGRDGEVPEEGPEIKALVGLAPPRGPIGSLSQQVLVQSGTRISVHWRPVCVYCSCRDAKMEILDRNLPRMMALCESFVLKGR